MACYGAYGKGGQGKGQQGFPQVGVPVPQQMMGQPFQMVQLANGQIMMQPMQQVIMQPIQQAQVLVMMPGQQPAQSAVMQPSGQMLMSGAGGQMMGSQNVAAPTPMPPQGFYYPPQGCYHPGPQQGSQEWPPQGQ